MNIRLSLLTVFMAMCNVAAAGTIRNALLKEVDKNRAVMILLEMKGGDTRPCIMKEIALVGICTCMTDEDTLDETNTFSKCFEIASLLNERIKTKRDNDLYANALEEIKSLVTTNQKPDSTPIEKYNTSL